MPNIPRLRIGKVSRLKQMIHHVIFISTRSKTSELIATELPRFLFPPLSNGFIGWLIVHLTPRS